MSTVTEDKVKRVCITLPDRVHDQGRKKGESECRSFSNYVEWLIRQDVHQLADGEVEA